MTPKEREAWNSRPVSVTVFTRCDECGELKQDPAVQKREYEAGYYVRPKFSVKATCCAPCFEVVKARAKAEAELAEAAVGS